MVLEGALDELMKDIRGNKAMNVGTGKVICERLSYQMWVHDVGLQYYEDLPQYHLRDHTLLKELLIQARWPEVPCDHKIDGHHQYQGHFCEQYISWRWCQEQALLCKENLLCTPSLDNTCQKCLLWIVCDISRKTIYDTPEMIVWASCDLWLGHFWF